MGKRRKNTTAENYNANGVRCIAPEACQYLKSQDMGKRLIAGKKSRYPTNAIINKNFIIRVLENPKQNPVKNTKLRTANTISKLINDDKLKMKLFAKVLNGQADKYTFLIRNRLKIDFCSK